MPASASAVGSTGVEMQGHVGDVLDCRWFPSGQVRALQFTLSDECLVI